MSKCCKLSDHTVCKIYNDIVHVSLESNFTPRISTSSSDVIVGLHITKVRVPTPLAVGEGGWLECEFVDEGESIYALKWYLGLDEFYRWTPAENPPVKTFPVKGDPLTVDIAASNRGKVKIHDVTLGASGVFRCEVSAEAPDFHTESDVATMTVVGECPL
nr:uncharacterized protein LOC128688819 [Cherax quadricarinatus]